MIHIERGENISQLEPFGKVEKRIINGVEDNLEFYFAEFLSKVLSGEPPPEWKVGERQAESGKPWWRVW